MTGFGITQKDFIYATTSASYRNRSCGAIEPMRTKSIYTYLQHYEKFLLIATLI